MSIRKLSIVVLALVIIALPGVVIAQEATPGLLEPDIDATPPEGIVAVEDTELIDVDENLVGQALFTETEDGTVTVEINVEGLPPGEHGVHVHETGICDPGGDQPFSSAGGHYNPAGSEHGGPPDLTMATPDVAAASPAAGDRGHAGDLGNIVIGEDGAGNLVITTDRFTLTPGPTSLLDADGSALVIHADPDDLMTDPSGNSGARIVCGVITQPVAQGTPVSTPEA